MTGRGSLSDRVRDLTEVVGGWDGIGAMLVLKGLNAGERWVSALDSSRSLGMTG